jgi:hypothetical protein
MAKKQTTKGGGSPAAEAPAGGGGWFQTGYDSVGQEVQRLDKQREDWANAIRRYWMPEKTGTPPKTLVNNVVFVDGIPFTYREHQFYLDGHWRNWNTCLIGTGEKCCFDEAGNKNYFVGAYTVLDGSEWKAKDGTIHRWETTLYPAKGDALKALRILADARGGDLAGCWFRVSRSGDKSPNMGNVFDFVERLPTKKIKVKMTGMPEREITILDTQNPAVGKKLNWQFKALVKPIDYPAILRPKTRAEALAWMGSQNIQQGGAGEESTTEVAY